MQPNCVGTVSLIASTFTFTGGKVKVNNLFYNAPAGRSFVVQINLNLRELSENKHRQG